MHSVNHNIVKAHSCAVQISHRATLNQYRAWLVLLKNALPEMGNPSAVTHRMPLADLWRQMGSTANRHDAYLKNLLRGLVDVKVEWNILNKCRETEWGAASLLAGVNLRGGMVEWDYSSFLRERLANPRMFALLNLSIVNAFKSKYALALYCIAADYKGLGATPFIKIEKYRQLMGLDSGEYIDFRALNRRLMKEPQAEINAISDLSVRAEYVKECRRCVAVRFHIQKNPAWQPAPRPTPQQKTTFSSGSLQWGNCKGGERDCFTAHDHSLASPMTDGVVLPLTSATPALPTPGVPTRAPVSPPPDAELPAPQAVLLRRLLKCGIAEQQARHFLAAYDPARLRSNIDLVFAAMQRKTIENLPAYTAAAITNDWAAPARAAAQTKRRRAAEALAAHAAACASRHLKSCTKRIMCNKLVDAEDM